MSLSLCLPDNAKATLGQTLYERIVDRTGRRVRRLDVDVTGPAVVVRGLAPTFHVKQLALAAIVNVLGAAPNVKLEIQVT